MSKEGQSNTNISNAPQNTGVDSKPKDKPKTRKKGESKIKSKLIAILDWLLRHKKIVFIIVGALIFIFVIFLIIFLMLRPQDNPTEGDGGEIIEKENGASVEEVMKNFADMDIKSKEQPYYEIETAVNDLISSYNVYDGCVIEPEDSELEDERLDVACISKNFDDLIKDANITDKHQLRLLELEKAKIFIDAPDLAAAWDILKDIKEENLLENQKHSYYEAMWLYYLNDCSQDANGDKTKKFEEKMDSIGETEFQ